MKSKIYGFIDDEKYVPILAEELVNTFENEANNENVEYSFVIDGKTKGMKAEENAYESNTYFVFDTKEDTCFDDFKKSLFAEDLQHIESGSKEETELMEDVREFLLKICKEVTEKYKNDLEKTIRRIVLGNKYKKETVPLEQIEVIAIDIADYTSVPEAYKYLLRISKSPDAEINTDEVISFIQDRQEQTGMEINDIFSIEKQAGNSLFDGVLSVETARKFLNEVSVYFFVDYSVNTPEKTPETA